MLALLIQSIYNIADSFFVARYSTEGLTALSIIYPVQLLITALATGTGAGVNILISRLDGRGETETQHDIIKSGLFLNMFHFLIFAFIGNILANAYFSLSTGNALVKAQGIIYSRIIFSGSFGLFIESICTKILQARGNMIIPMIAQVTGSVVNIVLDIILIFGTGHIPAFGIKGAAIATVIGQWMAMVITLLAVMKKYSLRGTFKPELCKWNWFDCNTILIYDLYHRLEYGFEDFYRGCCNRIGDILQNTVLLFYSITWVSTSIITTIQLSLWSR